MRLYREGVFLVAYEQSAYLFHRFVRQYKVSKKMVKAVGREVVSLGFPQSSVDTLLAGRAVDRQDGAVFVSLRDGESLSDDDFAAWKAGVPAAFSAAPVVSPRSGGGAADGGDIISRIMAFPLESRTPMECMLFVNELRQSILQA